MKKILVVDNDKFILEFMNDVLSERGHEVVTAEDGLSALDILETLVPDVIFVDLVMPNIGGEELCFLVRQNPALKNTFLVILSALSGDDTVNYRELGADHFIVKGPFKEMAGEVLAALEQPESVEHIDRGGYIPQNVTQELLSVIQRYKMIIAKMSEGVFEVTADGRITYANPSALSLAGLSEKRVYGVHIAQLFPDQDGKRMRVALDRLGDVPVAMADDSPLELNHRQVSISILPLNDETSSAAVILTDITKRKQVEKTLTKAKDVSEAASQTKSEFLANMSHEIRTPMNTILGFLELVLEDPSLPEIQRKHLATAQISANGLLGLINDILDVSKLESGKLTIEQHPFSLSRLMQEIHETMNIRAREKGLDLQLDIQPSLSGSFIGDPLRLRQIIINLVGNAIKFTQKGSVFILIMPAEEKDQLHFMIEDTGVGIPANRLSHIFEPFTQADASTTRQFGGTGLGTTISRELVELMGGRIWAESEEGKGSTFHFSINMPPTDQVPEEADLFIVPSKAVLPGSRRGFRILLAEDVEANVELAKIRLEQQDHEVTVAWNGREAVEAFVQGEFDLIIMDIQMPEMDGIEATKRIRALESDTGGHVPIIAMTASVMREETAGYLAVGMDAVVAKPVNFNRLSKAMEDVVPEDVGEMVSEVEKNTGAPSGLGLPALDGVDIKKGIQTWQNPEVYAKALSGFSRDYGNAAVELSRFINEDDMDSAHRIAHALKGVAGNLSVTEVADAAIHIDAALREKRIDDVKELLSTLAAALDTAIVSIRRLEGVQDDEEMPKKEMDVAHLKELFIKMLAAFDEFSPNAIEPFLSELKAYLSQDQLNPVVNHMERFDFDGAKQETVKIAKMLKVDLEG
ncbi:MAG: response regulator [Desulfobacteraceae bacterium]|nr:response regulator [Desulfobacteraceae bacterium]